MPNKPAHTGGDIDQSGGKPSTTGTNADDLPLNESDDADTPEEGE